jgi:predicted O-linked N-acetylglucosamine transferase (SPINDLY family)
MQSLQLGMVEEAAQMLQKTCKKEPHNAEAAHLHGLALVQAGQAKEGIRELERAIKLRPNIPPHHVSLGNALAKTHSFDRAAAAFQKAIQLDGRSGAAYLGLTFALMRQRELHAAIAAGREAVRLLPNNFESCANLADALREAGRVDEAIELLTHAHARFPRSAEILDLLLAARNYSANTNHDQAVAEARSFGELFGPPETIARREPIAGRAMRVGYLSADLRAHSVAYFLEPILQHHDKASVQAHVYSTSPVCDETTRRLSELAFKWVDASRLNHSALLQRLREDRLDILIELGGHTNNNRLPLLARRAAPVQATYLGYPNTTGVPAIQYRMVDALTDPPELDRYATEKMLRLPGCFLCYGPPRDAPDVAAAPVMRNGFITFGSFNSFPKMTDRVVALWSRILGSIPDSKLLLKNRSLQDVTVQREVTARFEAHGIGGDRLLLRSSTPTQMAHLQSYADMDIALDTFPYNGTTTTCEALLMGAPVVALKGAVHAGRVGLSLLSAVGQPSMVAETEDEYVAIATDLAANRGLLVARRGALRQQLLASPLCDGTGFTARFEAALREMCVAQAG